MTSNLARPQLHPEDSLVRVDCAQYLALEANPPLNCLIKCHQGADFREASPHPGHQPLLLDFNFTLVRANRLGLSLRLDELRELVCYRPVFEVHPVKVCLLAM